MVKYDSSTTNMWIYKDIVMATIRKEALKVGLNARIESGYGYYGGTSWTFLGIWEKRWCVFKKWIKIARVMVASDDIIREPVDIELYDVAWKSKIIKMAKRVEKLTKTNITIKMVDQ